jgi:predicted permease
LGIGLYLFLIVFGRLIVTVFQMKGENSGIYQLMIIIANTGFIGYPVLSALYGNSSIFPYSILHIPFNIVLFSYGIYITQKDKGNIKFDIKSALNPCVIASLISLIIFLLEIRIPDIFNKIFSLVGEVTIPLSMLLIGSFLALINIKDIFMDYKIYIISIIKLLILPFLIYFISKFFIDNTLIIGYLTLSAALPAGPSIMIMVNQYSKNEGTAAIGVFITTILSVVTIPLIIYVLLI